MKLKANKMAQQDCKSFVQILYEGLAEGKFIFCQLQKLQNPYIPEFIPRDWLKENCTGPKIIVLIKNP